MAHNRRVSKRQIWLAVVLLSPFAAISLLPLYWMMVSAFKPSAAILNLPPDWLPEQVTLDNFVTLLQSARVLRWTANSLVVASLVAVGNIVFDTMAGYAFARRHSRWHPWLFWMIMAGMMIPEQITMIPLFLMMVNWGWYNHLAALVVPTLATPFGIFFDEAVHRVAAGRIGGRRPH
ncbi:MAG: carbohydrate ABC transporter permease [candidate division KSB1 bacterium]|nr:carbohydrate ABC transporter permease [candidate division KSB1 bacterium]